MNFQLSAQDQPIRLGAFAIGPINSHRYYYGSNIIPTEAEPWVDRDELGLKYKFVKFLFNDADNWIDYDGFTPSFPTRSHLHNFVELSTYDGVGSSHGKHHWQLATFFNNTAGVNGKIGSEYTEVMQDYTAMVQLL